LLFWLKGIAAKTEFQINRTKSFENFSFGRAIHLFLQTYYIKHLTSLFFVSIVKRGYLLLSNFLPHFGKKFKKNEQKNNKNPKNYVIDVFASFSVLSQKDSNFKCLFNVFDF
jgi:hypothetical protein